MIDSTFRNTNRLFVLSFKNSAVHRTRDSFYKYYMSFVEIKRILCINQQWNIFWSSCKKTKRSI